MRKLLAAMFVALLMVGCGGRKHTPAFSQIPLFQKNAHFLKKGMTEKEVNSLLGNWREYPTSTSDEGVFRGISAHASEHDNKELTVHYEWRRPYGHPAWLTDSYALSVDFNKFGRLRAAGEGGTYLNGLHHPRTADPRMDSHSRDIVMP